MEIWVLTLWSLLHAPMEGGQYSSRERCVAAAPAIVQGLRRQYGRLWWRCDLTVALSGIAPGRGQLEQRAANEVIELVP